MTTATKYLRYCLGRCDELGVKLRLSTRTCGTAVNLGHFDDERREVMIQAHEPGWLTTLAHEMGHMEQWWSDSADWRALQDGDYALFDDWLAGRKGLGPRQILAVVRRIQRLELDAERRACRHIRDFKLGGLEAYIQGANCYVWQYEAARRWRCWVNRSHTLISRMPKRLMSRRKVGALPDGFAPDR